MAVTEYTCLKEQIKAHDQVLSARKRTLDIAKSRIAEMKNEKEKLRLLAGQAGDPSGNGQDEADGEPGA